MSYTGLSGACVALQLPELVLQFRLLTRPIGISGRQGGLEQVFFPTLSSNRHGQALVSIFVVSTRPLQCSAGMRRARASTTYVPLSPTYAAGCVNHRNLICVTGVLDILVYKPQGPFGTRHVMPR